MTARLTPTGDTFSVRCDTCIRLVMDDISEQHAINVVNSHNRKWHDGADLLEIKPKQQERLTSLAPPPKELATEEGPRIMLDLSGAARAFVSAVEIWKHLTGIESDAEALELARHLVGGEVKAHVPPF